MKKHWFKLTDEYVLVSVLDASWVTFYNDANVPIDFNIVLRTENVSTFSIANTAYIGKTIYYTINKLTTTYSTNLNTTLARVYDTLKAVEVPEVDTTKLVPLLFTNKRTVSYHEITYGATMFNSDYLIPAYDELAYSIDTELRIKDTPGNLLTDDDGNTYIRFDQVKGELLNVQYHSTV